MTSQKERSPKVLYGVTASSTARAFVYQQASFISSDGWEVHVVTGQGDRQAEADYPTLQHHRVPMSRGPSPWDLHAIVRLWILLLRIRPDVVVMGTPKMGLLGMVASVCAGIRVRVYLVHGLRWEQMTGWRRFTLLTLENLALACANQVVAVSKSVRQLLDASCVASLLRHAVVLGAGSANGIDTQRFSPRSSDERTQARELLSISSTAPIALVVGRINADKGLADVARVWRRVLSQLGAAQLVVVGEPELSNSRDKADFYRLRTMPNVRVEPHVERIECYYAAADVILMLSRREGMPTVILEAAACAVPCIAYTATGVVDAIDDGITGCLVEQGESGAIVDQVVSLLLDPGERTRLGRNARARVLADFDQNRVWQRWLDFLNGTLAHESHGSAVDIMAPQ